MKLYQIIILATFLSCQNKSTTKIVSKFPNGKLEEVYSFPDSRDTLTYQDIIYHENGKIHVLGNFEKGKEEGSWVWYFNNGQVSDSAMFHRGEYTGRRVHWDSLGKLKTIELLQGPCYDCCCDGIITNFYTSGSIQSEYGIHDGKKNGKYVYYYENGQPKKEQYYIDNIKNGNYKEWYRDGKLWVTGLYKNDKMDSTWNWFDSTGKLSLTQILRNGDLLSETK